MVLLTPDAKLARYSTEAPRIPWDKFIRQLRWFPGEHFTLIGPTGTGKTTMLFNVLPLHPYVAVFATKPADASMQALIDQSGYLKIERWKHLDPIQFPRRVLWPNAKQLDSKARQKEVFHEAFEKIYIEGGWTVALDELWWISNMLKLDEDIKTYLLQARSLKISLLSGAQRPAWIPREIYSACTHLMFWRTNDEDDLKSIGGVGWRSAALIRELVANLEEFQCLYVNTRTGNMYRTRCPRIKGV